MRQYNRPSRPLRYVSRDVPRRPAPRSVRIAGVDTIAVSPLEEPQPIAKQPPAQPVVFGWEFVGPVKKRTNSQASKPKLVPKAQPKELEQPVSKQVPKILPAKKSLEKPKEYGSRLIYSMATVIFLIGVGVALQGFFLNKKSEDQAQALTSMSNSSSDTPSEEAPKDPNYINNYKVAATLPRTITIPSIDVKARVLQVGVDNDNQMQSPSSIFDTGWYTGASKPGEMGAAVIDGHYSGPTKKGVFSKINSLKQGDVIEVERGDGVVIKFTVQSTEKVPANKVDMAKLLVSSDTNKPGLNLITCGGIFDARRNVFLDRTIVYATRS